MRGLALALCAALLVTGCDACSSRPGSSSAPKGGAPASAHPLAPRPAPATQSSAASARRDLPSKELTLHFPDTPAGALDVVIHVPPRAKDARLPLLLAFHGKGEAVKGPKRGPRGWIDDYWLPRAEQRLFAPPLTSHDLQNVSDDAHLEGLNAALAQEPFRGVIVACPYTPDILSGARSLDAAKSFGDWLVRELLPRIRRDTPSLTTREATGIDGVSLGGRLSVLVGLDHPETFGVVAGIQAAFDSAEAKQVADRAKAARSRSAQHMRLLTSEGDFFLRANRALSTALTERGVPHRLDVVPGPHDYDFNRGPGVMEMLTFHDRALRSPAGDAQPQP